MYGLSDMNTSIKVKLARTGEFTPEEKKAITEALSFHEKWKGYQDILQELDRSDVPPRNSDEPEL